jgi:hypothetical protein
VCHQDGPIHLAELDLEMNHPVVDEICEVIAECGATGETVIAGLHVWRVGEATYSCALRSSTMSS